jgi:hypothetical protein
MTDYATLIEAQRIVRNQPRLAAEIARQVKGRPITTGMTRRQLDMVVFIRAYVGANGIPPSFDEMKVGLGLASKSGVHRLVTSLEKRGIIERMPGCARAISLRRAA